LSLRGGERALRAMQRAGVLANDRDGQPQVARPSVCKGGLLLRQR
jgi:hypothetical protein